MSVSREFHLPLIGSRITNYKCGIMYTGVGRMIPGTTSLTVGVQVTVSGDCLLMA